MYSLRFRIIHYLRGMNTQKLPFEKVSMADLVNNLRHNGQLSTVPGTIGFFLCRRGWAKIQISKGTHTIREGDVYIYLPSAYIRLLEHSNDVEGIVAKSTLDAVLPLITNGITPQEVMNLSEYPFFSLSVMERERIQQFVQMIDTKLADLKSCTVPIIAQVLRQQLSSLSETFIYELIVCYLNNHATRNQPSGKRSTVFQNFMLSLFKNYKRERSVTFYAQEQNLSVRYFSLLVKEESGRSVSQWITEIVLSYARQALAHSDQSIKEIAQDFNFADQSFFGKYFKQHTGLSPKDYRKQQNEQ